MSPVVVRDVYELRLGSTGKLKLRAKALLAEDTPASILQACVLLHEAARIERQAVAALEPCPPVTRLAAAIEQCWCLVEGLDPFRAAEAWGRVLQAREEVDPATADAMMSRLAPKFEGSQREFSRTVASSPTLSAMKDAGSITGLSKPQQTKARKDVAKLLERYPGAASFWWMSYRLAEQAGDKARAWQSLAHARQLAPENRRFEAMGLLVAAWALPRDKADAHLGTVGATLERQGPEVCLMYALAEIQLARRSTEGRRERWMRAQNAADAGIAQASTTSVRAHLRAVRLLTNELLAGRAPTVQILYLAGLTDAAVLATPNANVIDLLTERARRTAMGEREAAA